MKYIDYKEDFTIEVPLYVDGVEADIISSAYNFVLAFTSGNHRYKRIVFKDKLLTGSAKFNQERNKIIVTFDGSELGPGEIVCQQIVDVPNAQYPDQYERSTYNYNCNITLTRGDHTLVGTTKQNDYESLYNLPKINGITLEGNKTAEDLGLDHGTTDKITHDGEVLYGIIEQLKQGGIDKNTLVALLRDTFLRKDMDDSTDNRLEVDSLFASSNFVADGEAHFNEFLDGDDYRVNGKTVLKKNANGESELEVDRLKVNMRALFNELVIEKMNYVGGALVLSPASGTVSAVTRLANGDYKCNLNVGNGERENTFAVGDFAQCKVYGGSGQKMYWRRVVDKGADYVTLSDGTNTTTDAYANSDAPAVGDTIVQMGNINDHDRQSFIIIESYREPSIKMYDDVSTMSLVGKDRIVIAQSGSKFTGEVMVSAGKSLSDTIDDIRNEVGSNLGYTLVLDNSNTSVACDEDGNIVGSVPSMRAWVYRGTSKVNATFKTTTTGCEINTAIVPDEARFFLSSMSGRSASIKVSATVTIEGQTINVPEKIITITKAIASASGEDAIVYDLRCASPFIWFNNANICTPTKMTAKLFVTQGSGTPQDMTSSVYLRHRLSEDGTNWGDWYSIPATGFIPTSTAKKYQIQALNQEGGSVLDSEEIVVLTDAIALNTRITTNFNVLSDRIETNVNAIRENENDISSLASDITQTAEEIAAIVSSVEQIGDSVEENKSKINATSNRITQEVSQRTTQGQELYSKIEQTASTISLNVKNSLDSTGIDIEHGIINLDANKTYIGKGTGKTLFTTNAQGKAIINTDLVESETLIATYPDGKKRITINDNNDGKITYWWPNGNVMRAEIFDDKGLTQVYYDVDGNEKWRIEANGTIVKRTDPSIGWNAKSYVTLLSHTTVDDLVQFLDDKASGEYYRTAHTPAPFQDLSTYSNPDRGMEAYDGKVANGTPIQATDPRLFNDWFTGWIVGEAELVDEINYGYRREYKLYSEGVYQETYTDNYNSSPV